jgi:hypothetical protein
MIPVWAAISCGMRRSFGNSSRMGLHSCCEESRHFERGVRSDFLQAYSLRGRTWAGRQTGVLLCSRGSSTTGLETGAHA